MSRKGEAGPVDQGEAIHAPDVGQPPSTDVQKPDPVKPEYPSTDLAYGFVQPSYGWMLSRLDAAEGRIQQLQAFAATLTFAAPVLIRSLKPSIAMTSPWFYGALGLFAAILALGIWARLRGVLKLPSLARMREGWLHLPEEKFKQDSIFFAAQHFEHNRKIVNRRGNIALAMTIGLGLEVVCCIAWWLVG